MKYSSITIFEKFLDGYNPITGEPLPSDHVLCEPEVIRAIHHAINAMKNPEITEVQTPETKIPVRLSAKREWTDDDDRMLLSLYMQNLSIKDMAKVLTRRASGIEERLDYLRERKRQQLDRRR